MSTLLDSLVAGFDGGGARRAALDDALRDGLPHARSEAWKYTPLRTRHGFARILPVGQRERAECLEQRGGHGAHGATRSFTQA